MIEKNEGGNIEKKDISVEGMASVSSVVKKETESILQRWLVDEEGNMNKGSNLFDKKRYNFLQRGSVNGDNLGKETKEYIKEIDNAIADIKKEMAKKRAEIEEKHKERNRTIEYNKDIESIKKRFITEMEKQEQRKWKLSGLPLDFDNIVVKNKHTFIFRSLEDPQFLVKYSNLMVGQTIEDLQKVVETGRGNTNPKIAFPLEVIALGGGTYISIMPDVLSSERLAILPDLTDEEAKSELHKSLEILKKDKIFVDRIGEDNIKRTPKGYSIMDLNTIPEHINTGLYHHMYLNLNKPDIPLEETIENYLKKEKNKSF